MLALVTVAKVIKKSVDIHKISVKKTNKMASIKSHTKTFNRVYTIPKSLNVLQTVYQRYLKSDST